MFAASGLVAEVASHSLKAEELKELQSLLNIELSRPLSLSAIDKGIRFVLEANKYAEVKVLQEPLSKQKLKIWIEGTRLRKIGNTDWSELDQAIKDELNLDKDWVTGQQLNIAKLSGLRDKIKQAYQQKGFVNAEIDIDLQDNPGDKSTHLVARVKTGERGKVAKVVIRGVEPDLRATLLELTGVHEGDLFDSGQAEKIAESITGYLKANQFPLAKTTTKADYLDAQKSKVVVVFDVVLGQRYQLVIRGNGVFDDGALKELITQEILSQTDAVSKIKKAITDKYRSVGFHFVQVDVQVSDPEKDGLVTVRITIDEGPKVLIDTVEFDGLWSEEAGNPGALFFSHAPGVLGRKVFWEAGLEEATGNFVNTLRAKGFVSATLTGPRIVFSEDKKGVRLFYDLQLGNQHIVKQISFLGNTQIKGEELQGLLGFQVNSQVNRDLINSGVLQITTKYQNFGYLDVVVHVEEVSFDGNTGYRKEGVEVRYKIQEAKQYRVGKISIEGQNRTQEKVIAREILVRTGEPYNPQKIRQSEEAVALTGLFSRVEIISTSTPEKPYEKNLQVIVSEIRPGFGEVGLGAFYEDPLFRLRSFVGLGYRNLFGLNQTASVRSEVSLPISRSNVLIPFVEYAAIVNYRAPYLADLPLAFVAQAGFDSFQIASSSDGLQSDLQTRARIEERIEKRILGRLYAQFRLHHLERTRTEIIRRDAESGTTQTIGDTTDVIGSTGPGLTLDLRNDLYNPTKGSFHSLDVEFAHPYLLSNQGLSFLMAIQKNSFYVPLTENLGLALYAGFGWASALMDRALPEARLANDLALGGRGSIRGYAPRLFRAPSGTRELAFYNLRSELTAPLFGDVSGAIFFDSGQLFPDMKADARNDGVGIGMRYKTPVGPVVLDLAHGLSPAAESIVRFTFTVGTI